MEYKDFVFLSEKKKEIDKVINSDESKMKKVEELYLLGLSKSMIKSVLNVSYNMVYNYIYKIELKKEIEELRELRESRGKKSKK